MSTQEIRVPDIGGAEGVEVIEICVEVGDQIEQDDSLVVLESDKASMEVPSPMAGTVQSIRAELGDSLSEGDVILVLELSDASSSAVDNGKASANTDDAKAAQSDSDVPSEAVVPPKTATTASDDTDAGQAATVVEVVTIPDIGSDEGAEVIEVCVKVGDQVSEGDSLVVLETDKASMEVPAPKAGTIASVAMNEGDTVASGDRMVELEVASAVAAAGEPAPSSSQTVQSDIPTPTAPKPEPTKTPATDSVIPAPSFATLEAEPAKHNGEAKHARQSSLYAGPAVRKLARELGVNDLGKVKGSGPKGRITKSDLKAHIKEVLQSKTSAVQGGTGIPAVPEVDFSAFGEVDVQPLNKIQKLTAANMQRNWLNIPHVTQFDDADISELEEFRQSLKAEAEQRGVKITPLAFLIKACACVLKNHAKFNASLHSDGEHLVYKKYVHIGVAVDTPAGLLVPVIRDADKKSIWQLAEESAQLAAKAKQRKLTPADMQGGCFTISSLGGIGGQGFTPIVNAPEVAILGVSRLTIKPQWNGSEFVPRKMLPLALSYDHRAINGVDGGKFLTELAQLLSDIRRLAL